MARSLNEQFQAGLMGVTVEGIEHELKMPDWMQAGTVTELVESVKGAGGWTSEQAERFVLAQARQNLATQFRQAYKGALAAEEKARDEGKPAPEKFVPEDWFPNRAGKRSLSQEEKAGNEIAAMLGKGMTPEQLMEILKAKIAAGQVG